MKCSLNLIHKLNIHLIRLLFSIKRSMNIGNRKTLLEKAEASRKKWKRAEWAQLGSKGT